MSAQLYLQALVLVVVDMSGPQNCHMMDPCLHLKQIKWIHRIITYVSVCLCSFLIRVAFPRFVNKEASPRTYIRNSKFMRTSYK